MVNRSGAGLVTENRHRPKSKRLRSNTSIQIHALNEKNQGLIGEIKLL